MKASPAEIPLLKRERFLWPLTQSHHRALLAARRIRETLASSSSPETPRHLAHEVAALYGAELKTHFADEETVIESLEKAAGVPDPDFERVRRDHRVMEALIPGGDRESLLTLAETLREHIRFEEEVVFPKFESRLGAEAKAAVGKTLTEHSTNG